MRHHSDRKQCYSGHTGANLGVRRNLIHYMVDSSYFLRRAFTASTTVIVAMPRLSGFGEVVIELLKCQCSRHTQTKMAVWYYIINSFGTGLPDLKTKD